MSLHLSCALGAGRAAAVSSIYTKSRFCLARQVELFKALDLRPDLVALHESHDDESCRPLGCKPDLQA